MGLWFALVANEVLREDELAVKHDEFAEPLHSSPCLHYLRRKDSIEEGKGRDKIRREAGVRARKRAVNEREMEGFA